MTQSGKNSKVSAKEYFVVLLILLAGMPVFWYWGARDGRALAAKAYGENGENPKAAAAEESDDDYEDEGDAAVAAVPESSPESIERGAALYKANCVACHGEKGDGKGPAAVAFTPAPRDFTDPGAKWTQGNAPAQIFATVSNGVEGTGMAGFAGALTEEQRWDLVHYVASLAKVGKGSP